MTFVFLGSCAERHSQEARKQTGRKGGCSRCIFSCALPPCSMGRQLGRRAQGQMVAAAGSRAQRAAEGISLCTTLEEQIQSLCPTGATFCQSVSQAPGLCHPNVLSGSLQGVSPAENSLGAVHIPSCWNSHLPGTRALPPGVSLVPEQICLSGHFQQKWNWNWGRVCDDGDLQLL